eukprot:GHVH01002419.1.p1 GENE.GHVH01002419.1~~GHVH01002419.1.p1  ORF type:complete len:346 (-),score=38.48 GHVH01002419.1:1604-2641(-)
MIAGTEDSHAVFDDQVGKVDVVSPDSEVQVTEDCLVILVDLSVSSWYQIHYQSTENFTSVIPLTVAIFWGSICRFVNAYSFGWPSMDITILGVHEKKLVTLFSGKAEIFDAGIVSTTLKQFENELDDLIITSNIEDVTAKNAMTQWQHAPMMSVALTKALLIINKKLSRAIKHSLNGRVLILDASSIKGYASQETPFSYCLHATKKMSGVDQITIDVCTLQSHYPSVLETLSEETNGIFISFPRELLMDGQDSGIGINTITVSRKEDANELSFAFSDFLLFHYLPTTEMRKHHPFFNIVSYQMWIDSSSDQKIDNEKLVSHVCACHLEPTHGIVLMCPCCAASEL